MLALLSAGAKVSLVVTCVVKDKDLPYCIVGYNKVDFEWTSRKNDINYAYI